MSLARQRLTPLEYLHLERAAEHKSEYLDGRIYLMAGANRRHNLIVANVVRGLGNQFEGRACEVFSSDMRVKVSETGLYTYPDVVAVCAQARFEDEKEDTLINPAVILEVLSTSTESYDRGEKFAHYRRLASLCDYVLIVQDRIRVEHFHRQVDGGWLLRAYSESREVLELSSIDCSLPLGKIYDKVRLATPTLHDLRPADE